MIGNNKLFMLIGYGFTTILSPLFSIVTSPLQTLIIRFIERIGKEIRTTLRDILVTGSSIDNEK